MAEKKLMSFCIELDVAPAEEISHSNIFMLSETTIQAHVHCARRASKTGKIGYGGLSFLSKNDVKCHSTAIDDLGIDKVLPFTGQ